MLILLLSWNGTLLSMKIMAQMLLKLNLTGEYAQGTQHVGVKLAEVIIAIINLAISSPKPF